MNTEWDRQIDVKMVVWNIANKVNMPWTQEALDLLESFYIRAISAENEVQNIKSRIDKTSFSRNQWLYTREEVNKLKKKYWKYVNQATKKS